MELDQQLDLVDLGANVLLDAVVHQGFIDVLEGVHAKTIEPPGWVGPVVPETQLNVMR